MERIRQAAGTSLAEQHARNNRNRDLSLTRWDYSRNAHTAANAPHLQVRQEGMLAVVGRPGERLPAGRRRQGGRRQARVGLSDQAHTDAGNQILEGHACIEKYKNLIMSDASFAVTC